jgi:hypothetical protein
MVEDQEEKEFQQFDWWRTKVCPLGLHTRHHCPNESTLQNAYMAILLESFGTKNFTSQPRVWARLKWKPKLWSRGRTMALRISPLGKKLNLGS